MPGISIHLRFDGELNDFLSTARRNTAFEHIAAATDTLKHIIESVDVPHTEIGHVLVNGSPAALNQRPSDGADIHVFPRPVPVLFEKAPAFVVDGHLGRLAAYLRMLGFDTWYERSADDPLLASISSRQHRLLLTRDNGLLKRREVELAYFVRADKPLDQLREISRRFALPSHFAPFTRCMECNGLLAPVSKSDVDQLLPPHTRETKNEFSRCTNCGRIFWRGSHHARMLGWIEALTAAVISSATVGS